MISYDFPMINNFQLGVFRLGTFIWSLSLGGTLAWDLSLGIWGTRPLRLGEPTSRRRGAHLPLLGKPWGPAAIACALRSWIRALRGKPGYRTSRKQMTSHVWHAVTNIAEKHQIVELKVVSQTRWLIGALLFLKEIALLLTHCKGKMTKKMEKIFLWSPYHSRSEAEENAAQGSVRVCACRAVALERQFKQTPKTSIWHLVSANDKKQKFVSFRHWEMGKHNLCYVWSFLVIYMEMCLNNKFKSSGKLFWSILVQ